MNYYEHHIGDFLKKTVHLSAVEEGIYRRLLDRYYTTEAPLPADLRECCKLARATSKPERDAVRDVLADFFTLEADGHHQKRADEEIARFKDKQAKAKRSAEARWSAHRPQSEGNANAYANASTDDMRTHMRTQSERNAPRARPQSPDTSNQTPIPSTESTSTSVAHDPSPGARVCLALKAHGIRGNPSHPLLIALVNAGATPQEFADAAPAAKGKADPFAYLLGVVQGRRRDAAEAASSLHKGAMPQRQPTQAELNAMAHGGFGTGMYAATFDPTPTPIHAPETVDVPARLIAP